MGRAGILAQDDRVELLEGEVIVMSPIGSRHAACVDRLNRAFFASGRLAGRALVRVRNPPAVSGRSELQPDLMLLVEKDDDYAFSHPEPADVLLLVVADSSIDYDRRTKIPSYARAASAKCGSMIWSMTGSKPVPSRPPTDTASRAATRAERVCRPPRFPI